MPDHKSKLSHACQLKEAQSELLIVSTSEKNGDVPSSIVHLNISGEVARSHMRSESVSILVQLSVQINDSYVVAHPKGQHHQAQGIKDAHQRVFVATLLHEEHDDVVDRERESAGINGNHEAHFGYKALELRVCRYLIVLTACVELMIRTENSCV